MRWDIVIFLSGINLIIIQFVSVRNISAILFGTEVIIFLITLSYFTGFSAGYFISNRISSKNLCLYGLVQWLTHLTIPFSLRWLAAVLASSGHKTILLICGLFLGGFWLTSFYSVLLPWYLSSRPDNGRSGFVRSYGLEIAGAIAGVLIIFTVSAVHPAGLMCVYQSIFVVILYLIIKNLKVLYAGAVICVLYFAFFPVLDNASVAYLYRTAHGIATNKVLLSSDTPYQRVEVLEDSAGDKHLYLDGIRHYGSESLSQFNYFIAGLPASLLKFPEVIIIGSGSYGAVKLALRSAKTVTSVEIDDVIAKAGQLLLAEPFNADERANWNLVIDDAKHYLGNTEKKADLIAMDIAGPFQRQVALLYTREFFNIAQKRLNRGGIVSVCLNGDLAERSYTACRIVVTLLEVFKDVFVIVRDDGRSSFALAGDFANFSKEDIVRKLEERGEEDVFILDRRDIERHLEGRAYNTISMSNMDIVLLRGLSNLRRKYFRWEDD